jgi:hypothetical protein
MEKKGLNAVNVKLARTISSPPGGDVATTLLIWTPMTTD